LLAFGRKSVQQPRVLDLNHLVTDLHKMLCRLIGEDIELTTDLAADLHGILGDPGQIEQVVVNLAVNARDAIHAVQCRGEHRRVSILTANVRLPQDAPLPPEALAGDYVQLTVNDTGCGMTEEIRQKIFEPFFTTKEQRNGTGLGLATVYTIVKQSNGYIEVGSELGRGTVFRLSFPAVQAAAPVRCPAPAPLERKRGSETLLIVEDDANLRFLMQQLFQPCGFTLLFAPTGEEALRLADAHPGPIHLLIADVVLPRLSGPEVASRLKKDRPGLKVLFISGYSSDAIARRGPFPADVPFLQKPFTPSAILRAVRDILDRDSASPGARRELALTTETSTAPAG
jgi:CheY-like chemotaxis protein